jgi:transcriptional regulator of acetoin/glycerol metabolism
MLADGTLISERELAGAFPADVVAGGSGAGRSRSGDSASSRGSDVTAPLQEIERDHIVDVLRRVNGNRMAAARLLGISRRALYRRLERHHIDDEPARMPARRNLG